MLYTTRLMFDGEIFVHCQGEATRSITLTTTVTQCFDRTSIHPSILLVVVMEVRQHQ